MFDDMIADMAPNKKLSHIATIKCYWKLSISPAFKSQSYFKVSKTIRLNVTHYIIMKIPDKVQLQQVASNHSSDINFKDFMDRIDF